MSPTWPIYIPCLCYMIQTTFNMDSYCICFASLVICLSIITAGKASHESDRPDICHVCQCLVHDFVKCSFKELSDIPKPSNLRPTAYIDVRWNPIDRASLEQWLIEYEGIVATVDVRHTLVGEYEHEGSTRIVSDDILMTTPPNMDTPHPATYVKSATNWRMILTYVICSGLGLCFMLFCAIKTHRNMAILTDLVRDIEQRVPRRVLRGMQRVIVDRVPVLRPQPPQQRPQRPQRPQPQQAALLVESVVCM